MYEHRIRLSHWEPKSTCANASFFEDLYHQQAVHHQPGLSGGHRRQNSTDLCLPNSLWHKPVYYLVEDAGVEVGHIVHDSVAQQRQVPAVLDSLQD